MENIEQIIEKAKWCLNCKNKPCNKNGCPMHTDIPEFINKIKAREYEKAYEILISNNVCSHICGLICPHELQCEGKCLRGIKQSSTKIGELEKFVNEWAEENNIKYNYDKNKENGKKVAIIGSGPAGIECAFELLKNGFDVTIFEKENKLGGILTYGIPDFRLPKNLVLDVFKKLIVLGVKIRNNTEFGKDIDIEFLKQNYDFIFLGTGVEKSSTYKLTSADVDGIYNFSNFLKAYNEGNYIKNLGNVVVIGGGNVAMDSARVAIRMGAESVKILYRRDEEHMPARKSELNDAINDGVEFLTLTNVLSVNNNGRKIESINCIKTKLVDGKAENIDNSEFKMKADTVIFAIGSKINREFFEKRQIKINENGLVDVDENGMTSLENVYAGGDLTENRQTVCKALASGKKAAWGIIKNS